MSRQLLISFGAQAAASGLVLIIGVVAVVWLLVWAVDTFPPPAQPTSGDVQARALIKFLIIVAGAIMLARALGLF